MRVRGNRTLVIAATFAILILCTSTERAQVRISPQAVGPVAPIGPIAMPPGQPVFQVRSYLGRCLDFSPPPQPSSSSPQPASQVVIYDCNATPSQQIWVEEIDSQHDVILHAGNGVLGINRPLMNRLGISPSANPVPGAYALEVQGRANPITIAARNQIFTLDGDSIILASSRPCVSTDSTPCPPPPPELVVQTQNAQGGNWTPLIVGPRNLTDSEFWDFNAIDGSGRFPTHGFVRVTTDGELWNNICADPTCHSFKAGPGSVIVIDPRLNAPWKAGWTPHASISARISPWFYRLVSPSADTAGAFCSDRSFMQPILRSNPSLAVPIIA